MKIFTSFSDEETDEYSTQTAAQYSTSVYLPASWHTLTARFIQSPIAPPQCEVSVFDEDTHHRESFTLRRADAILLREFVKEITEFFGCT